MKHLFSLMCLAFLVFAMNASAQLVRVPGKLNYQGKLTSPGGTPVVDASYPVKFTMYDTSGLVLWTETQPVTTSQGLFSVALGSSVPIPMDLFENHLDPVLLGIKVGADPELTPRTPLVSVPFAILANDAAGWMNTNDSVTFLGWGRRVGMGTTGPRSKLEIYESGSNPGAIFYGSYKAIEADASSSNGSNNPVAIFAHVTGNGGITNSTGISAVAENASSNFGASSTALGGSANYALYGFASGPSGSNNYGLSGQATSSGATNYGVRASAYGSGSTNFGVYATVSGSGAQTAVYGNAPVAPGSYAAWFDGDVNVVGTLSKSAGSFKIDHPLDPEHKYLQHSFVESPDMMNIYNGNVTTDASGNATVTLPDWFESLNQDFRYQLTVIGQFAQAIVSSEISGNKFEVKTDKPNVKVSWQVTGIRHDPFAQANRIQVEVSKEGQEVGTYLHPEVYGKGDERSVNYASRKKAEVDGIEATKVQDERHR